MRDLMCATGVILALWWGIGSIYYAVTDPSHDWLQGMVGLVCLIGAVVGYALWFHSLARGTFLKADLPRAPARIPRRGSRAQEFRQAAQ
jgi:hypothetical protein